MASKKETSKKKESEKMTPKIRVKLRAYDHKIIDNSARQIVESIERAGSEVIGPIPLPTETHKYTVNRSSFVHKDAREQFEMRIHKSLIEIPEPSARIIDALRDITLPAGVDIEIKT